MRGVFRRILATGVACSLLLPVAMTVVFGLGVLLGSLGDATGAAVCGRIALALATVWLTAVIATAVASGIALLADRPRGGGRRSRRIAAGRGREPGHGD